MVAVELPCDGDGACMVCKAAPPEGELVLCGTCATPWHAPCLSKPLPSLASVLDWQCPDCSPSDAAASGSATSSLAAPAGISSELIASVRAIEADASLTEQEKARRRQALLGGGSAMARTEEEEEEKGRREKGKESADDGVLGLLDDKFNCSFCMQLPERPVTTPCGHNFCLKCFQKWVGQGKHSCAKCRAPIPSKMASQPRINSALVQAIRMARTSKSSISSGIVEVCHFMRNEDRPDKAFTTERAKKAGKANACCGQIFVTVPPDHFGPILAENDPRRNRGVLVGDRWEDRLECRQWGVHLPHVAGIAGQSDYGAQSVALSGGYEDDEDHGEWFLYTGSGGRDLSGNKRTNKEQSFDQKFEKLNEALRVSCKKGYPVRVVRSHKEKRSSYAPESGVRYDGIYRIEKCWRKVGVQGFKVCRYLFVRCDNAPAPWTCDEHGDRPRPLPDIKELKKVTDVMERKERPAWDFDEENVWRWMKNPPVSRKQTKTADPEERKRTRKAQNLSVKERLLKEFSCFICRKVMTSPLTTPCAHNFCKPCLLGSYAGQSFIRERTREGGRTLRAQKIVKRCPCCPMDISDFLQNPQVNRELSELIESLKHKSVEEEADQLNEEGGEEVEKCSKHGSGGFEENTASENGYAVNHKKSGMEGNDGMECSESNMEGSDACVDEKLEFITGFSEVEPENCEMEGTEKDSKDMISKSSSAQSSPKRENTTIGRSYRRKAMNCVEADNELENKKTNNAGDICKYEGGHQKRSVGRPCKKAKKSKEVDNDFYQKSNSVLDDCRLNDEVENSNGNYVMSESKAGGKNALNQVDGAKLLSSNKRLKKTRRGKNLKDADDEGDASPSSPLHVPDDDDDDFQ